MLLWCLLCPFPPTLINASHEMSCSLVAFRGSGYLVQMPVPGATPDLPVVSVARLERSAFSPTFPKVVNKHLCLGELAGEAEHKRHRPKTTERVRSGVRDLKLGPGSQPRTLSRAPPGPQGHTPPGRRLLHPCSLAPTQHSRSGPGPCSGF